MLIGQSFFLTMNLAFNLLFYVFNHLFTTFLKPTIESSLSTSSNRLSEVAFNLSNDVGSWSSQSMTLTSKIQRISVLTTSSQTFFPFNLPSILPPTFIQIWWGFFPTFCFASDEASLSFLSIFQSALAAFKNFNPPITITFT